MLGHHLGILVAAICLAGDGTALAQSGDYIRGTHASRPAGEAVLPVAPIYSVTAIEAVSLNSEPKQIIVRVRGLVPSDKWTNAQIVPTVPPSQDHMLDLMFVAQPGPSGGTTKFTEVEGFYPLDTKQELPVGIRVRSATNVLVLKGATGAIQITDPKGFEIESLIGKKLVSGGGGAGPRDVNVSTLPMAHRIIGPDQPISDLTVNSIRLTIFLDDKGVISYAAWQ